MLPDDLKRLIVSYLRPEEALMCIRVDSEFYRVVKPMLKDIRKTNDSPIYVGDRVAYLEHKRNNRIGTVTHIYPDGTYQINNTLRRRPAQVGRVRTFPAVVTIEARRMGRNKIVIGRCPGCHAPHFHAGEEGGLRLAHCRLANVFRANYYVSVSPNAFRRFTRRMT